MPGDDDVVGGALHDHRGLEQLVEVADPGLVVPLLVLGRVVVGVLADVAVLAGPLDPLGDLLAPQAAAPRHLLLETRVGLGGKVRTVHRGRG